MEPHTGTSTSDALTSNDIRATQSSVGHTIAINGFSFSHSVGFTSIERVRIGLEARKNSSPATETAAYVDVVTGTTGDTGTVTSGTVTSNASHFYLAGISRRKTTATVTGVSGLGLTWTQVETVTGSGGDTVIDLWKGEGTPTGNGTVTASFSATATNAVIGIYRFSNVDLTSPIQNHSNLASVGNTSSYSGSITGTNKGIAATFLNVRDKNQSAVGNGFTERNETLIGTASLVGNTLALTATGSQAFSGTISANIDWVLIAVTLTPVTTTSPVTRLSYELSAVAGITTGDVTEAGTSDNTQYVNITSDRSWVAADVANVKVISTLQSLGAATLQTDNLFLEIRETSSATSRICITEIGGDS